MIERFKLGRPHLSGWKAIAAYLGVSERTVWELHHKHGLPVYKSPTGYRYAIPAALDLWMASRECRNGDLSCPFCKNFNIEKS